MTTYSGKPISSESGIRQYKPYPAYKDSGVEWLGRIPVHWEVTATKRLCHITNGGTPKSSEPRYWDGEIIWVTPEDLGNLHKRSILSSKRTITSDGQQNSSATIIPADSLVLSTRAPIGHVGIADVNLCTNQGCRGLVFRYKCSEVYHYFQFLAYRSALEELGQGSTFNELSTDSLGSFRIGLPPLREQRAIAAFLDRETARIDALVARKEQLIELLQEKRTALISQAVTRGLDPEVPMKDSGVEWLGEIPAHWEVKRLKYAATMNPASTETRNLDGSIEVSFVPMETVGEYGGLELTTTKSLSDVYNGYTYFRDGDVLVAKITPCFENGKGAIASGLVNEIAFGTTELHVLRVKESLDRYFLFYLSIGDAFRRLGEAYMYGTAGQKRVPESFILNLVHPLPPLPEQRAIAAFLDRETAKIDALVTRVREAIDRLKELRQSLISAAVTGKIDVRQEAA